MIGMEDGYGGIVSSTNVGDNVTTPLLLDDRIVTSPNYSKKYGPGSGLGPGLSTVPITRRGSGVFGNGIGTGTGVGTGINGGFREGREGNGCVCDLRIFAAVILVTCGIILVPLSLSILLVLPLMKAAHL